MWVIIGIAVICIVGRTNGVPFTDCLAITTPGFGRIGAAIAKLGLPVLFV